MLPGYFGRRRWKSPNNMTHSTNPTAMRCYKVMSYMAVVGCVRYVGYVGSLLALYLPPGCGAFAGILSGYICVEIFWKFHIGPTNDITMLSVA